MRIPLVPILLLTVAARATAAQQSPEQVVDSAFRAIARRDWAVLRDLMDPGALDRARQEQLGMLILVAEQRRAGQKVGGGYDWTEVVIADHLATVGRTKAPRFGNATIAELAALPPGEFYLRWLDAAYAPGRTDAIEDIVDRGRTVVGSLTVGDSAWVVYREDSQWQEDDVVHVTTPGSPEILPLHRVGARWRIIPNFELAHGPDVTGMFDDSPMGRMPAATRREVTRRTVTRPGPPRHADAAPSPTVVVDSAFAALARKDWPRLVALVDSQRLAEFKSHEIEELAALLAARTIPGFADSSSGGMMVGFSRGDSGIAASVGKERVEIIPGAPTIDELLRLSPAAFFVRWCEGAYASPPPADAKVERRYLGVVFEGEDLAHVLYRSSDFTFDLPAQVMRMPLRYADGRWRILLNDEIGGEFQLVMHGTR